MIINWTYGAYDQTPLYLDATGVGVFTYSVTSLGLLLSPAPTNNGDNTLVSITADTNYGTTAFMSSQSGAVTQRAIIQFDFSALPAGATIVSATVQMYYYNWDVADPVGNVISLNRVTQTAWKELKSTWNQFDSDLGSPAGDWTSAGGDFTGVDSVNATVPASFGWMSWGGAGMLAQAQYAQANTNEIIHLISDPVSGSTSRTDWYSRDEAVETTKRPMMEILYIAGETQEVLLAGGLLDQSVLSGGGFNNFGGYGF